MVTKRLKYLAGKVEGAYDSGEAVQSGNIFLIN